MKNRIAVLLISLFPAIAQASFCTPSEEFPLAVESSISSEKLVCRLNTGETFGLQVHAQHKAAGQSHLLMTLNGVQIAFWDYQDGETAEVLKFGPIHIHGGTYSVSNCIGNRLSLTSNFDVGSIAGIPTGSGTAKIVLDLAPVGPLGLEVDIVPKSRGKVKPFSMKATCR